MRAAKVQASLHIRAVSPEPPLLAHTSSELSRTFRLKARSLTPLNGWACAVKICHDGMLEHTNSLDGAQLLFWKMLQYHFNFVLHQTKCKLICTGWLVITVCVCNLSLTGPKPIDANDHQCWPMATKLLKCMYGNKWLAVVINGCIWSPLATTGRVQMVTDDHQLLQMVSNGYQWLQMTINGC